MEKVLLIGCGQHCAVVLYNMQAQGLYEAVGIVDVDPNKTGSIIHGKEVLGDYSPQSLDRIRKKYNVNKFFIAFGAMKHRKKVFNYMIAQGWEPITIIHPNATVSAEAKIGKGCLIECGCLITPNPIIGDNVVINTGSQVNHDNIIGDHVFIASGVILSGGVSISQNTLLDDGVIVTLGCKVGKNALIGAGSIVTKNIPDDVIAYGCPCKIVRYNSNI